MTSDQQAVWTELIKHWQSESEDDRPILLHGVTGSGKTEIYLQAMAAALRVGHTMYML